MALLAAVCVCPLPASADEPAPSPIDGNVQFTTNYVGRGISGSQGLPSVGGEIDYNRGAGWYGGLSGDSINWIDQLYPGSSVGLEADGWLGYRTIYDPDWTTKFAVLRLQFPGRYVPRNPPTDQPNTTELIGYVAWRGLSAELHYALSNYFAAQDSRGTTYLNLTGSRAVGESWTLSAHIGRRHEIGTNPTTGQRNSLNNYTDYKLQVAYDLGAGMSLKLAHTWTNADSARYIINGYDTVGHHTWMLLEKDF